MKILSMKMSFELKTNQNSADSGIALHLSLNGKEKLLFSRKRIKDYDITKYGSCRRT